MFAQECGDIAAGSWFVGCGDGILEVENDGVGRTRECGVEGVRFGRGGRGARILPAAGAIREVTGLSM